LSEDPNASKSERTRLRILHAAAKVFRQNGYAASSLRDVAESAGMQAGSLYYHFDSKEALAEAVMDQGVAGSRNAAIAEIEKLGPMANPLERIEAAFRGHLAYTLAEADFAVATLRMLHQTPEAIRMRHLRKQRSFGRFYAKLFEEARDAGFIRPEFDLSALRMLLLGALNWSPEWFDQDRLPPNELVRQLSQMMQHGIMPTSVTTLSRQRKQVG